MSPDNSQEYSENTKDNTEKAEGLKKGIHALLENNSVSSERLPMLEVVCDRLVRMLSTSLRNFTSDNVEINIISMDPMRFGDYLSSLKSPCLISVFKAEEWDNYGLMVVDSDLIYSIVDVLLGGRRSTSTAKAVRVEGRTYTTIERTLMERMIRIVLSDLTAAFDPVSTVTFRFDRLETNPKFAAIVRPNNAGVLIRLSIEMEERGGVIEIMFPYSTLEPVREQLLQMFMGEKFGRDSIWETHLANELCETDVEVDAILEEISISLDDILNWKKGSKVLLGATPESPVTIRCGNRPLFSGTMGRKGEFIAIKIERVF